MEGGSNEQIDPSENQKKAGVLPRILDDVTMVD
jgi:hypothetical protein